MSVSYKNSSCSGWRPTLMTSSYLDSFCTDLVWHSWVLVIGTPTHRGGNRSSHSSCWGCFCSVTLLCPALCDPMDCSMLGFPVLHYLPRFAQTHVHLVDDAIQPSHPLLLQLLLTSIFLSIRVFSNELVLHIRWPRISWFFTSASAAVLPMNIQDWFPLGLTGLISLLSKRLSRVFSSTTIWKHQFFGTQFSLWSNFHIYTWLLEKL